jgi:transposase-like protein
VIGGGTTAVTFMQSVKRWKCRGCTKQFSVKVNTIFEESPLSFDKWLPAVWMIVNASDSRSASDSFAGSTAAMLRQAHSFGDEGGT